MPYFIFRISSDRKLSLVRSFEKFPEAKKNARAMRAASAAGASEVLKIIFANDPAEAEQLLTTRRGRPPSEDD